MDYTGLDARHYFIVESQTGPYRFGRTVRFRNVARYITPRESLGPLHCRPAALSGRWPIRRVGGRGLHHDFDEGGWDILDRAEKGFIEAMEKFRKDFDERMLERLLALNLERAAEQEKAAKVKKPKTSRAKKEDEML